jgi:N-acetylmuramoyl-L-alanine amidase
MKQNAKQIGYLFFILTLFMMPDQTFEFHESDLEAASNQIKTLPQILEKRNNYANRVQGREANKLVNILIVPGHDDEHWGAEFNGIKEVELNRALAQKLYTYLSKEEGINPVLVSDESGYNTIFETYFRREKNKIEKFIKDSKKSFSKKIDEEDFSKIEKNFHNTAPSEVAHRLYGINRWVNSQNFDLVIHIHFNDYPGRKWNKEGKHDGFSIYTPGTLFDNHDLSRTLADSVYEELKKIRPVSSLEEESDGVIEDHELIALGSNESLQAGSILIEYGYIYEPIFTNEITRETSLDYFAYATYAGVKKLLQEQPQPKEAPVVAISKNKKTTNNLIWQFEKTIEGAYPPKDKTLRDCPISGYFGECSGKVLP